MVEPGRESAYPAFLQDSNSTHLPTAKEELGNLQSSTYKVNTYKFPPSIRCALSFIPISDTTEQPQGYGFMNSVISRFISLLVIFISPIFSNPAFSFENDIEIISKEIATKLKDMQLETIAVSDFTDLQGNVTELGRYLAEKSSIALATSAEGFSVIDRTHLKSLLQEHKLAASGIIDPATARQLGKIAGVKALVTGNLVPIGDQVDLTVKVLDVETAKIILAKTQKLAKTEALIQLMERNVVSVTPAPAGKTTQGNNKSIKQKETGSGFEQEQLNLKFKLIKCKFVQSGYRIKCIFDVTNVSTQSLSPKLLLESYINNDELDRSESWLIAFSNDLKESRKQIQATLEPEQTEKGYLIFPSITAEKGIYVAVIFDNEKFSFKDIVVEK